MSFKREGNDSSWLNNLRKRLVNDLLACDVPEDEAMLTRHGRYACVVCPHKPVLDTLAMLQVHRNGKKHQQSASIWRTRKQEDNDLRQKRENLHSQTANMLPHRKTYKDSKRNINESHEMKSLLSSVPYQGKARKHPAKGRQKGNMPDEDNLNNTMVPEATQYRDLPGMSEDGIGGYRTISEYRKASDIQQDRMKERVKPYMRPGTDKLCTASSLDKLLNPCSEARKNAYWQRRNAVSINPSIAIKRGTKSNVHLPEEPPETYTTSSCAWKTIKVKNTSSVISKFTKRNELKQLESHKGKSSRMRTTSQYAEAPSLTAPVNHYLHARGSGWKKDLFGQWVKDEDAEFDSDEEPPDLP